jgi:uncharacterized membrane-anchored protein
MVTLQKAIRRVPEITLVFWLIKTLSTTVGETGADYLAVNLGLGMPLVAVIMSAIMATLLYLQFARLKRYVPLNYWSIVILMSIIGTLITDMLVDLAGVSLETLSVVFTIAMILGFAEWYRKEKTLSIHSIDTGRREFYYWVVILLAFALGTGVGDLISERLAVGYGWTLLLFSGLIAMVSVGFYVFKINGILAFWLAYILTRPLGASLGDYLTQPLTEGGLGLGMVNVNFVFFAAIATLVTYLTMQKNRSAHLRNSLGEMQATQKVLAED